MHRPCGAGSLLVPSPRRRPLDRRYVPLPHPTKLPIIVGAAGHRDVLERPSIPGLQPPEAAVEAELRRLIAEHPHTPIIVLTGLAEGSDALVADVVLRLASEPQYRATGEASRVALVSALPMPLDACALDFAGDAHVRIAERLISSSAKTIILGPGDRAALACAPAEARRRVFDDAYARLAAYVSRNCHVLLALWNGSPQRPGTVGGTADVVRWFREGPPASFDDDARPRSPLRTPDGLLCIHVPCERASEPGVLERMDDTPPLAAHDGPHRGSTDPRPRSSRSARETLRWIDQFNADVERRAVVPRTEPDVSRAFEQAGSPGTACVAGYLDALRSADDLALATKHTRRNALRGLFALGGLALVAFELAAHGPEHILEVPAARAALLFAYVAAFVASMLWVRRAAAQRLEDRFLHYRALAEALRVQCFWRALGLTERADDGYAVLHSGSVAWVRHGLKGLHLAAAGAAPPAVRGTPAITWVRRAWIGGQAAYFRSVEASTERTAARLGRTARWLLRAGVGLALACIVGLLYGAVRGTPLPHVSHTAQGGVLISIVLLTAGAGMLRLWCTRLAHEATADRSRAAAELFERAGACVDRALAADEPEAARATFVQLGREALEENVAWVLLHRDHPLEPVSSG